MNETNTDCLQRFIFSLRIIQLTIIQSVAKMASFFLIFVGSVIKIGEGKRESNSSPDNL